MNYKLLLTSLLFFSNLLFCQLSGQKLLTEDEIRKAEKLITDYPNGLPYTATRSENQDFHDIQGILPIYKITLNNPEDAAFTPTRAQTIRDAVNNLWDKYEPKQS